MKEQIIIWVLGFLSTIFGGLNILQLVTMRAYKRTKNAEADKAEIEALRSVITGLQEEVGRLQDRVEDADKRATESDNKYNKLFEQYYALKSDFEKYKITHSA